MKLIPNWKQITFRAWSMLAQWAGLVVLILPEVLFLVLGYDVASPRFWWGVAFTLILGGMVGRVIDQGIGDGK